MIKHSQRSLDKVNENITRIKEYSSKLGELQSGDKEVFWKALKYIITKSIEGHKETVMDLLNERNSNDDIVGVLKFHGGCIFAYKEILEQVEKNQDVCDKASARLKELKDQAEEIKSNIDLQ